ncbi:hypothetical protein MUK42_16543 [Musa troglodytarum]|uniref:Uncharacterized protein n=1 Tax=Musa troglodytarum TaxID=320322 RepID=A0A9E7EPX4_9LILI|nr:hypothetical protein MUK42_16543 [Musa troglodytarum]
MARSTNQLEQLQKASWIESNRSSFTQLLLLVESSYTPQNHLHSAEARVSGRRSQGLFSGKTTLDSTPACREDLRVQEKRVSVCLSDVLAAEDPKVSLGSSKTTLGSTPASGHFVPVDSGSLCQVRELAGCGVTASHKHIKMARTRNDVMLFGV